MTQPETESITDSERWNAAYQLEAELAGEYQFVTTENWYISKAIELQCRLNKLTKERQ